MYIKSVNTATQKIKVNSLVHDTAIYVNVSKCFCQLLCKRTFSVRWQAVYGNDYYFIEAKLNNIEQE